ncbi:MAG: hypothetical protein K0R94_412 [Burkholderiales bacterium]|jgi:hypothetical protein|nr:hypothetical protein [Burkholderiales bacterium]
MAVKHLKIMLILACTLGLHNAKANFLLGDGYQPSTGATYPSCLLLGGAYASKNTDWDNPSGSLSFTQIRSLSELKKLLGAGGELSLGMTQFNGKAEGSYLDMLNTNNNTEHILYFLDTSSGATLNLKRELYNKNPLGMLFEPAAKLYGNNDISGFSQMCGTHYIGRATAKVSILVDLAITFKNKQAKEEIDAKIKADVATGGAKIGIAGMLNLVTENANNDVSISFSAKQFGGDPSKLAEALSKPECKDKSGNTAIVACGTGGPDSLKACNIAVTCITNYGTTIARQLKESDKKTIDYKKYFYTDPEYYSYASLFGIPDETLTLPAKEVVDEMAAKFNKIQGEVNLLKEYMLRVGEKTNDKINSGYTTAEAHRNKLNEILNAFKSASYSITKSSNIYMEACLQKLDKSACDQALNYINQVELEQKQGKYEETNEKTKNQQNNKKQLWAKEIDTLEHIENNNFDINLLTLKSPAVTNSDGTATSAKFQQMTCSIIPTGSGIKGNEVRIDCPDIAVQDGIQRLVFKNQAGGINLIQSIDRNYGKIELGGAKTSLSSGANSFTYGINDGKGQKYCFLYNKGITLNKALDDNGQPSEFGEYEGKVDIRYKVISDSIQDCPDDISAYANKVVNKDMGDKSSANKINAEQQELTTYYPSLIGIL